MKVKEGLSTEVIYLNPDASDLQFTFITCRASMNRDGNHFTPAELAAHYITAINKKIDLKSSQELTDVVGDIVAADLVEDETGGRVECVGKLYAAEAHSSRRQLSTIRQLY
jgi:hypothetical protein